MTTTRVGAVIARLRALLELGLACAALVGAGVSWLHARHTVRRRAHR